MFCAHVWQTGRARPGFNSDVKLLGRHGGSGKFGDTPVEERSLGRGLLDEDAEGLAQLGRLEVALALDVEGPAHEHEREGLVHDGRAVGALAWVVFLDERRGGSSPSLSSRPTLSGNSARSGAPPRL